MTNTHSEVSGRVGERFVAGDGYIQGVNLELEPPSRILQSWRTTEFEESDEDSRLEILLEAQDFVSMHVLVPGKWTVRHAHTLAEQIENDIRKSSPNRAVFTHIEPQDDPEVGDY